MNITSQIIDTRALLTFAFFAVLPQQSFAYPVSTGNTLSNPVSEHESWKSVIITEIMADPSPPTGLPDTEYIELYNRSGASVSLDGWKISDTSASARLGNAILQPDQYIVLTSKGDLFGKITTLTVSNLPSLNNTGDSLTLTDPAGHTIDVLVYSDEWYGDAERSKGGWSLELIDLENTCEAAGNWSVSEDLRGGTPGQPNSIMASNPDLTSPLVLSARSVDAFTVRLSFSEKLAVESLSSGQWIIHPSLSIATASFADSSLTAIDLHFGSPMQHGVLYELSLPVVFDCAGNPLQGSKRTFALPEPGLRGDVVINEILFNPPPNGVDFVELFNVSKKYIDLNGWAIGTYSSDGHLEKSTITQSLILKPDDIIAFCARRSIVQAQYAAPDSSLSELKLPAYADDGGTVVALNASDSLVDVFTYSEDMHNPFIRDPEGVSLERISAHRPSEDMFNWTSAGSWEGYGTPGRRNSAERIDNAKNDQAVRITPSAFSPPNGQPNYAEISYHFDRPGLVATVNVYDTRGLIVRRLANNAILGTTGTLRWHGDRDDGNRAQTGYYMIWFQVFGDDGTSNLYREAVAISPAYK